MEEAAKQKEIKTRKFPQGKLTSEAIKAKIKTDLSMGLDQVYRSSLKEELPQTFRIVAPFIDFELNQISRAEASTMQSDFEERPTYTELKREPISPIMKLDYLDKVKSREGSILFHKFLKPTKTKVSMDFARPLLK